MTRDLSMLPDLVATAICSLPNSGGVSWAEARRVGEKVARALPQPAPPEPDAGTLAAALEGIDIPWRAEEMERDGGWPTGAWVVSRTRKWVIRFEGSQRMSEANALVAAVNALASRPAPRPPEPDRTAALTAARKYVTDVWAEMTVGWGHLPDCACLADPMNIDCDCTPERYAAAVDRLILAAAPAGAPVADGTAERCAAHGQDHSRGCPASDTYPLDGGS
jgi:hypothetical protein